MNTLQGKIFSSRKLNTLHGQITQAKYEQLNFARKKCKQKMNASLGNNESKTEHNTWTDYTGEN